VRIELQGRNIELDDELREQVTQRFKRVGEQVSDLATLEVKLAEERNPSIADKYVVDATLRLKGATLRAHEATPEMVHSIHEAAEDIRRQVKRHSDKRRKRHQTRRLMARLRGRAA
jgi:putative sigma-54 modulation protein